MTDEVLMGLVANLDDRDAFAVLFSRWYACLVRYFRGRGLQQADAEDAVGELFQRLWRFRRHYDGRSFSNYLYTIARHVLFDFFRRNPQTILLPDGQIDVASPDTSVDVLDDAELLVRLYAARGKRDRGCLKYRYWDRGLLEFLLEKAHARNDTDAIQDVKSLLAEYDRLLPVVGPPSTFRASPEFAAWLVGSFNRPPGRYSDAQLVKTQTGVSVNVVRQVCARFVVEYYIFRFPERCHSWGRLFTQYKLVLAKVKKLHLLIDRWCGEGGPSRDKIESILKSPGPCPENLCGYFRKQFIDPTAGSRCDGSDFDKGVDDLWLSCRDRAIDSYIRERLSP